MAYLHRFGGNALIVVTTGHHTKRECREIICDVLGFEYPRKTPKVQPKVKPVKAKKSSAKCARPTATRNKEMLLGVDAVMKEATLPELQCGQKAPKGVVAFLLKRKKGGVLGTSQGLEKTPPAAAPSTSSNGNS